VGPRSALAILALAALAAACASSPVTVARVDARDVNVLS